MDGTDIKMVESEAKATPVEPVGAEEQKNSTSPEPPFVGFDEGGRYFVVKIDIRYGYRNILGFLVESMDWLKVQVAHQQREAIEKQKKILRPNFINKAAGRLNLFK